jgi:bacillithiol biosynthesis cysteine-adding enzyme BshC
MESLSMPQIKKVAVTETPYVSKLARDYFLGKDLGGLSPGIPTMEQIISKAGQKQFTATQRESLINALYKQYKRDGIELEPNSPVTENIEALRSNNTFTFTTGQQIHIFLGPLFFVYKIQSLIAHARQFNDQQADIKTVPVFWMATEDHDLEEIDHVKLYGTTFTWETNPGNAVGRLKCEGLQQLIEKLEERADKNEQNAAFFDMLRRHYTPEKSLAAATRSLIHELFGNDGLLIIDPDDKQLKQSFLSTAKKDIQEKVVHRFAGPTTALFKKQGYEPRVNPQEINYFWLDKDKRIKLKAQGEHIIKEDSGETISMEEIFSNIEKLSPNVLTRPLYQETILPNILFLGGSAEVEYWLPLQQAFAELGLQFPVLIQRDSVLILSSKNLEFIESNGFGWEQLFKSEKDLAEYYFEFIHQKSEKLSERVAGMETVMSALKEELEKRSTPGAIFKEINDIQKAFSRLEKMLADEELRLQKENVILGKILKLKAKFFDTKQERDEFVVAYPGMVNYSIEKTDALLPELFLNTNM